jgi:DNA-binding transcriptional MerR regulator
MKILVEDEAESWRSLRRSRSGQAEGVGISEMAERLNAKGTKPPQGATWTKSLLYNLRLRLSHIIPKPHNERPYGDNEVKERILELRANGHSLRQIAAILNEQGWLPLKARRFTVENIHGLLARTNAAKLLSPRRYLQMMLTKMERAHEKESPGEPFEKPSCRRWRSCLRKRGTRRRGEGPLVARAGAAGVGGAV